MDSISVERVDERMASIQDTKDTVGALCAPNDVEDVDSPSVCTVQIRARVSFQRERPATKQYISPVKRERKDTSRPFLTRMETYCRS